VTKKNRWWEKNPKRYRDEVQAMKLYTNAAMTISDCTVVWHEKICSEFDNSYDIAIVCQENHPFEPPQAYILKPEIEPSMDIHINYDGHLDLSRDRDIISKITVLDIRNGTCLWVTCYEIYQETREWIGCEH